MHKKLRNCFCLSSLSFVHISERSTTPSLSSTSSFSPRPFHHFPLPLLHLPPLHPFPAHSRFSPSPTILSHSPPNPQKTKRQIDQHPPPLSTRSPPPRPKRYPSSFPRAYPPTHVLHWYHHRILRRHPRCCWHCRRPRWRRDLRRLARLAHQTSSNHLSSLRRISAAEGMVSGVWV